MIFFARYQYFDHYTYLTYYGVVIENDSLTETLYSSRFEPGFVILSHYLSRIIPSPEIFFFLISSVVLIFKYRLFIKNLYSPFLAWLLYSALFIPVFESNQLRTAIATFFLLYVIMKRDKFKAFLFFPAFFSMLFHYIGFIILFFNLQKRMLFFILGFSITAVLAFKLNSILNFLDSEILPLKIFMSTYNDYGRANIFSTIHISQFCISILGLLNWKKLSQNQKRGLFLIFLGSFLYIIFSYNPAIAHRIREVSLLGIFPLLFSDKIKWSNSFALIIICVLYITGYTIYWHIVRLTIL